ncbi:hypothetical protein QJQ45_014617 [Haematococcus lacustris]|nr:hypothetical protein QJQ45_014617 [Haematococcus lacustris]
MSTPASVCTGLGGVCRKMASKDINDYVFRKLQGQTLIKVPGSIAGNGFILDRLTDCEVYILDHTSQVQVDDCVNCRIFIGPCDGSVFARDCKDCVLCVAARQLRTRDCQRLNISLYCPTNPSIETSSHITFSAWRGAYPGAVSHFAAAHLDPQINSWDQVYDFNAGQDVQGQGGQHWQLAPTPRPLWRAPPLDPGLLALLLPPMSAPSIALAAGEAEDPLGGVGVDPAAEPESVGQVGAAPGGAWAWRGWGA